MPNSSLLLVSYLLQLSKLTKSLQLRNIFAVILLPLCGIWLAIDTPLRKETAVWAITYYFLSGIGITAGYHRLWSHRSFRAGKFLEVYLSIAGAACLQGSILEWARNHRAHHRFVDTNQDPYSINKGLLYAHMGWLIFKQDKTPGIVDTTDLNSNKIVLWQDRYFSIIAIIMGLAVPSLIAGYFWGDWKGGIVYAGILRIFFFQQATFCVNSLAHWLGDQPFDDRKSPRDHVLTALVTFGEGYHNFHHEFPSDYRNGIKWHQYDPSKWFIWFWGMIGLACNLNRFSQNTIKKSEVQQKQKWLDKIKSSLDWGASQLELPLMTWDEFQSAVRNDRQLICISAFLYDIEHFVGSHPGGRAIISAYIGKDATAVFNGGVYCHSNAAFNLLDDFRCAILSGGVELAAENVRGHVTTGTCL